VICKKCGGPCEPTDSEVENRMIWCRPCRKKQRSHTPEYRAWKNAISRCTRTGDQRWASYGGRGIRVCERWLKSFESFLADVGPRPSGAHSLDRVENDGDYEPGNVRWATRVEQQNNLRVNRRVSFQGKEMTLTEAARLAGIKENTVWTRIERGWPEERWFSPVPTVGHRSDTR
jgi:hypothetical protein